MGGEIGFLDREGGGTVFYFELPVAGGSSAASAVLPTPPAAA
jgi:signal transduction histidine kinase